ncbi:MAG: nicotinate-nucleotide adenylyltransferase [Gammaproteobacteria bacterium]|nr:nicotinate-nucleotide adenylyltransferase [Gammaproteobacteria bacterium]MBT8093992.1 nicotinate-nucleotide adenylyltransferase [Gammaproteobacteria bacterium]MBT8105273.1 nicotinate-nucleotide adenylyltransferase [Gammaproteobacteria bacterium]NNF49707.1 nicotinate-nucleotide adenylyltransferase [Woeseiaceae bacterium]NNK25287.1 nicotinate-nucleotide adenylyltransferase [Woeseiaceae bacterium]
MRPIGVFGGTFDPVHYGHLRSAFEMLQALSFEQVSFVPCGDPPHRGVTYATSAQRLRLVELAIAGQDGFVADDRELRRGGPSYTVDTLQTLREEHTNRSLGLIVGMDAFLGLTGWHRWDEILDFAHIVVAHRPGWKAPDIGELGELVAEHGTHRVDDLHNTTHGFIHIHAVTQLEIASTEIRDLVAAGRDPRFLMPDAVRDEIENTGLYKET